MLRPVDLSHVRRWRPYSWSTRPFVAQAWPEIRARYLDLAQVQIEHLAVVEIIDGVLRSDVADRLAGAYTIGGMHVVDRENRTPPYSVISVDVHGGGRSDSPAIAIWHESSSGLRDQIVVAADAAVPLFWRFMSEKLTIPANHPHQTRPT